MRLAIIHEASLKTNCSSIFIALVVILYLHNELLNIVLLIGRNSRLPLKRWHRRDTRRTFLLMLSYSVQSLLRISICSRALMNMENRMLQSITPKILKVQYCSLWIATSVDFNTFEMFFFSHFVRERSKWNKHLQESLQWTRELLR